MTEQTTEVVQKKKKPNIFRSDKQKLEAVQTFLMTGGAHALTCRMLKIPEATLHLWRRQEWWHDMERAVRTEENLALSSRLKKILDKSMDIVVDRLENGDWIYDQKTGEMRRKPVAMKDAQKAVVDFIDRREKLNKQQTTQVATEMIEDKLAKLAQAFSDLAKPKQTIEVTDVMFVTEEKEDEEDEDLQEVPDSENPL